MTNPPSNPTRWQPRSPWKDHSQARRDKAAKLRTVLLPSLERIETEDRSQAEFENDLRTAYAREFGHTVSGSAVRFLFQRTVKRDRHGGIHRNDWMRLEIFLDDYQAPGAGQKDHSGPFDHTHLKDRLDFADPDKPTLTERQNALEYSFRHFDELASAAPGQRNAVKRSILDTLYSAAPGLAESPAALRRTWDRKYNLWKENGQTAQAVRDGRAARQAGIHLADLKPDLDLIVAEAFHHDGKLALAIRKLRRDGKLSQAFTDRYTLDVRRNKSYVAKSVRAEIAARLTGLLEYRRSQFKVDMAGPRIARSHNYQPGDCFSADDVTWNNYFWYPDDAGQPQITRGECLLFADWRSQYALGYVLTPGHYNSETIRRGILNIHDNHGLPHRAFIFEKGIWESRLIEGSRRDFLGWREYEMGLQDRGLALELRHATTPQGKLIEGIFNIVQQSQRDLPGFVGFNERDYSQEELQRFIGRVRRGLVHPSEKFLSIEQWRDSLDRCLEQYNSEPQNGKLLQGASPAEMFASHQPLRKLPDDARFLLASHRVRVKVKQTGIGLTIRGQRRFFYNENLGEWRGREVYAWFNLEQPDLLTVTDLQMKNGFSIPRYVLPAFDASNEQLAEANRARRGFMKSAKLEFDRIKHPVRTSVVRDNVIDEKTQRLGSHIREQTGQFAARQTERKQKHRRVERLAEEAGVAVPASMRNPDRVARGIELELAAEAKLREEEEKSHEAD